jgi:hypothetical protein
MSATIGSRIAAAGFLVGSLIGAPQIAAADPIGLTVNAGPSLQQTMNRPCVIGDPSCHNPKAFSFTLIPPHTASATISSPTYTVAQLRQMVGDTFFVGVDLNQARGHDGGAYDLLSFSMSVNGSVVFKTAAPTVIKPVNPGNGYSDASIVGFNLTGLPGTAIVVFTTKFSGGTAGREQYFLHAATAAPSAIGGISATPEPVSLFLVGAGLVGTAAFERRRQRLK